MPCWRCYGGLKTKVLRHYAEARNLDVNGDICAESDEYLFHRTGKSSFTESNVLQTIIQYKSVHCKGLKKYLKLTYQAIRVHAGLMGLSKSFFFLQ